jgi:peptide/nickel transport system permease protein
VAVFAPLIAPQNPYDLSEIRLEDSRQPPGSQRMTDPWETDLVLAIDPTTAGRRRSHLGQRRRSTRPLAWTRRSRTQMPSRSAWCSARLDGFPLEPLRLDDLPRGAELDIGEKHSFRSFWTVEPRRSRRLHAVVKPHPGSARSSWNWPFAAPRARR